MSEIDCGKPNDIENGLINANGYYYSNVIEYKCVTGYRIRNGDYLRECNSDGKWSGIEPTCERNQPQFESIKYQKLKLKFYQKSCQLWRASICQKLDYQL